MNGEDALFSGSISLCRQLSDRLNERSCIWICSKYW